MKLGAQLLKSNRTADYVAGETLWARGLVGLGADAVVHRETDMAPWPPTATGVFADVKTDHLANPRIEQLADEEIMAGFGISSYSLSSAVTRARLAVIPVRTLGL